MDDVEEVEEVQNDEDLVSVNVTFDNLWTNEPVEDEPIAVDPEVDLALDQVLCRT